MRPQHKMTDPDEDRAGWVEPEDFATVVRCAPLVSMDLIVRDPAGRVLVGRRRNAPAQGWWFVPGGRIRKGERLDAALKRLTREELGAERGLVDAHLLGVFEHHYPDNALGRPGVGTHYVVLGYAIHATVDTLAPPDAQHDAYRWLTPRELLATPDVHENTKAYLR